MFDHHRRDEVVLNWGLDSATQATINMFSLPAELRGQGLGTKLYKEWEDQLPVSVTHVELWTGNIRACGFWRKMGFLPKWPGAKLDDFGIVFVKKVR